MAETEERRPCKEVLKYQLEKLKGTATSRKQKEFHQSIVEAIENLPETVENVDEYFAVFKQGCTSAGSPKTVAVAIDSLQKFLANHYLNALKPDVPADSETPETAGRILMDTYIESVCQCQEQNDDHVQLQMIRAILTAVTSRVYGKGVREKSLMLAVRTCFQLHRDSKNTTNQSTAQASLTQMLNVVTQRMELSSTDMVGDRSSEPLQAMTSQKKSNVDLGDKTPMEHLEKWVEGYVSKLVDDVVHESGESEPERGKFGYCIVCHQPAAHYCIDTTLPVCNYACKQINLGRIALINTHFAGDVASPRSPPNESMAPTPSPQPTPQQTPQRSANQSPADSDVDNVADEAPLISPRTPEPAPDAMNWMHRDALMVFKALCAYSMKVIPGTGTAQPDQKHVRSKRLSLELLHNMLVNSGPVFRSSERFMGLVKTQLLISLIKNCVSPMPSIFGQSLTIFEVLITSFKEFLKGEIGVFIEKVFLQILGSGNSTYQHKHRVLKVFYKLMTDKISALELFLNFDCSEKEANIFEGTVDCLAKIAQGRYLKTEHVNLIQPQQEMELKSVALDSLITLVGSLIDWTRESKSETMKDDEKVKDEKDEDEEDDEADIKEEKDDREKFSQFQAHKDRKALLKKGVTKFNIKPKKGLEFFYSHNFIERDNPEAVAKFFLEVDGLSKTEIGDYLGENITFNKEVLHRLADSMVFADLDLDEGLRKFLSTFRLPGEAQKIDRMMEKFAEKFHTDNPGKFTNADTAFVLSYSLIMLQTDLHSDQIKNKMTKEEFIKTNRGIDDSHDLPREFLEQLYENIKAKPISLGEDDMRKMKLATVEAYAWERVPLFLAQANDIIASAQAGMRPQRNRDYNYVQDEDIEYVAPIFEVICWPLLATLSVTVEMNDARNVIVLCVKGFKYCIRLAGMFNMQTERDAFVSSLAKFTNLATIKEIRPRNIECIKALLHVGLYDGNTLGSSWFHVLHCVSQLERLQMAATKAMPDWGYFGDDSKGKGAQGGSNGASGGAPVASRRVGMGVVGLLKMGADELQMEIVNSESVLTQIDSALIDRLFAKTTQLNSRGIVAFVTELCRISKEELNQPSDPRIFSLQKLVEVADMNIMCRMRLVWSRVWKVLCQHFVEVATHPNNRVCMYAIDSLRQLAMKFLEREELSNYNFQVEFLRPFEVVIQNPNVSMEMKELVVSILANMIQSRWQNIKSGWKAIFEILRSVSQEVNDRDLVVTSFQILEKVLAEHFNLFADNFHEGARALVAFGVCQVDLQVSLDAIVGLKDAASYLGNPRNKEPSLPRSDSGLATFVSHQAANWFPILRGLSSLVSDSRKEVRTSALSAMFDCLKKFGAQNFDADTWQMVFRGVLFPLFDDIHHQLEAPVKSSDARSALGPPTCLQALRNLVELFDRNHEELQFLLPDVLTLIKSCVIHKQEPVARVGVEGMKNLMLCGAKFSAENWIHIAEAIEELVCESLPRSLLVDNCTEDKLGFDSNTVVTQCVVQLLLIDVLQEVIESHLVKIPVEAIKKILDALQTSFEFAHEFNGKIPWRQKLKQLGFMREMRQIPGLLRQEREGMSCFLKILFRLQKFKERPREPELDTRLVEMCRVVLHNYIRKERQMQNLDPAEHSATAEELEREISGQTTIVCDVVLRGFLEFDDFAMASPTLFPLLSDLCLCQSREVRVMVRDVLLAKVAPMVRLPQATDSA
eukprot:GEMP01001752.1.p1 GENE.GEMP01001752.1~~GEMP01001752.1.p1  ORF type:complete len:1700 (+),score=348.55 GEMP01001752.1:43-5142(+)